jgi:predicted phage tail protein
MAAMFYSLTEEEAAEFPEPDAPLEDFPDELISTMARYSPISAASVHDAVDKLRVELDTLRNDIRSREDWYKRLEESLDRHDKQIGNLLLTLEAEKQARQAGETAISTQIAGVTTQIAGIRGSVSGSQWIVGILITVVVALMAIVIALLLARPK